MIQVIQKLLNKKYNNERGITLVELLIAVILISLIVGLVSTIYLSTAKTSKDVIDITKSEIDSRLAVYRISHDLREASSIILARDDQVYFLSNIDLDDDYEEVRYFLRSENGHYNLVRSINGTMERVIAANLIDGNIFTYYSEIEIPEDGMSTPIAAGELKNIKLIEINVSIDQSGSQSLRTMDLDTLIALRNKI